MKTKTGHTKTMPCAICKKKFPWSEVVRVRGLGMWCLGCMDKHRDDEEEAGGTKAGGLK